MTAQGCDSRGCWISDHFSVNPSTGHLVHFGDEWCDGWTWDDWTRYTSEKYSFTPPKLNWRGKPKPINPILARWHSFLINREWENNSAAGKAGY